MYSAVSVLGAVPERLNEEKDGILISYLARLYETTYLAGSLMPSMTANLLDSEETVGRAVSRYLPVWDTHFVCSNEFVSMLTAPLALSCPLGRLSGAAELGRVCVPVPGRGGLCEGHRGAVRQTQRFPEGGAPEPGQPLRPPLPRGAQDQAQVGK